MKAQINGKMPCIHQYEITVAACITCYTIVELLVSRNRVRCAKFRSVRTFQYLSNVIQTHRIIQGQLIQLCISLLQSALLNVTTELNVFFEITNMGSIIAASELPSFFFNVCRRSTTALFPSRRVHYVNEKSTSYALVCI